MSVGYLEEPFPKQFNTYQEQVTIKQIEDKLNQLIKAFNDLADKGNFVYVVANSSGYVINPGDLVGINEGTITKSGGADNGQEKDAKGVVVDSWAVGRYVYRWKLQVYGACDVNFSTTSTYYDPTGTAFNLTKEHFQVGEWVAPSNESSAAGRIMPKRWPYAISSDFWRMEFPRGRFRLSAEDVARETYMKLKQQVGWVITTNTGRTNTIKIFLNFGAEARWTDEHSLI